MPKLPTAPITTPLLAPPDADIKQDVERLTRKDRECLNSFVRNLNRGISVGNMDDDLRAWWANRY